MGSMRRVVILCSTLLLTACGTASLLGSGPSVHEERITEKGGAFSIEVRYPVLSGYPKTVLDIANQQLRATTEDRIAEFKRSTGALPPDGPAGDSTLTMSSETTLLSPHVASFLFTASSRLKGAANPNRFSVSLTLDMDRGVPIEFKDLFQNADVALPVIAQVIDPKNPSPVAWEDLAVFTLGNDGVTVLPGTLGQEKGILIMMDILRPLLSERGTLVFGN
jgi:hypothetical protein